MTARSYCNQALLDAGLPIEQPNTLAMLSRKMEIAESVTKALEMRLADQPRRVVVDGEALQRARNDRGWSARQLAAHAGVSTGTVYSIENGRWASSQYIAVKAVADALGVDLDDILVAGQLADAA